MAIYAIHTRGLKPAYTTDKAAAWNLYEYCRKHFSGVSITRQTAKRFIKDSLRK